jgi:hypothetical protein
MIVQGDAHATRHELKATDGAAISRRTLEMLTNELRNVLAMDEAVFLKVKIDGEL